MNSGVPPTALNARTGDETPPGITFNARAWSCFQLFDGSLFPPVSEHGNAANLIAIRANLTTQSNRLALFPGEIRGCFAEREADIHRFIHHEKAK